LSGLQAVDGAVQAYITQWSHADHRFWDRGG